MQSSIQKQELILEDTKMDVKVNKGRAGKVVVSGKRTLEVSESYANFSNATNHNIIPTKW